METLAVKYRPKTFEDVTGQNYTVDILKYQIENDKTKQAYLFSGASGCGKALENSTPVLTADGWRPIKDIKVGDSVYGSDGDLHKVTGVYPQPPRRQGFIINFSDKTSIIADAEHLWTGHWSFVGSVLKPETKTTKELYQHYTVNDFTRKRTPRFRIRRPDAVLYTSRVVEIPPMLYGLFMISIRKIRGEYGLHLSDKRHRDIIIDTLLKFGVRFKDGMRVCAFGRYGEFLSELEFDKFDYWQKFIKIWKMGEDGNWSAVYSEDYLKNSVYARIKLLTGICMMAYDRKTLYQINTNKIEFAEFLWDLVSGLGCNGLVHKYIQGGHEFYRVQVIPNSLVMERICEILPFRKFGRDKNFKVCVSIESIVPAKQGLKYTCIEVDSPDHLYVIQNYILTHNTTVARIFANKLGDKTEIIEVDAASNSGVDNVRALIEEAQFKSLSGGKKVYIWDEAHNLSKSAMETFLKTLEEPPEDVIFIFCTTEPHKLPKTIQNRMMRFNFTRMENEQIVDRLAFIMESEQRAGLSLKYSNEALSYIARVSHGGMRDAIANMEKCINSEKDLTVENVCGVLSLVSYNDLFLLTKAVLNRNDGSIISIIEDLYSKGVDLKQFVNQFMLFVLDLLKFYYTADIDMTELPSFFQEEWDGLGINDILLGDLKHLLAELMGLNSKLVYESNPKPFLEMILMGVSK